MERRCIHCGNLTTEYLCPKCGNKTIGKQGYRS